LELRQACIPPAGSSIRRVVNRLLLQRPRPTLQISGGVNGTVLYAYDEAGHLLGEYDATGTLIEETVWLGDTPVATLRPNGSTVAIFYIHSDPLNTPRQITRPSDNTPMWTWNADPFGTDAANPNPAGAGSFPYEARFSGQVFDGTAGLHENGAREYDPATGSYLQSDPFGLNAGLNTYAYVGGSPLMFYDPYGLYSWNDFINDAADYSAGFGDSLSFGLTAYAREGLGINGGIDKCSAAYRGGELSDLAFEVGTLGLSAGMKALARNAERRAVRNAARSFTDAYREANGYTDGIIHHANPLFGHPGNIPTTFPTGGLPAWVHSGDWNLRHVADQAAHNAAHRALRGMENIWGDFVNPATTAVRAGRDAADSCGCGH
jgi:RHS repeat-associated protein